MAEIVDIKVDKRQMKEVKRLLSAYPKGKDKALNNAVNKTSVYTRADIVKTIREDYRLKSGELKKRNVQLKKSTRRTLKAHIKIKGSRISLERFGASQTRQGIAYTIKKSDGRKRIRDGFTRPDKKGIWRRLQKKRTPITELHGPSVPEIFENMPELKKGPYNTKIVRRLEMETDRQVKLLLEKGK